MATTLRKLTLKVKSVMLKYRGSQAQLTIESVGTENTFKVDKTSSSGTANGAKSVGGNCIERCEAHDMLSISFSYCYTKS